MTDSQRPYRILIVDDAPSVREGLRWALDCVPGVEVVGEAANGFEALTRTAVLLPDALILDIEMPVMDGLEVAAAIKCAVSPPKILFLSAHNGRDLRERAIAAGGDGFAEKSQGWPALISELRAMLNLSSF